MADIVPVENKELLAQHQLKKAIVAKGTGLASSDMEDIEANMRKAGATDEQIREAIKQRANAVIPPRQGEQKGTASK